MKRVFIAVLFLFWAGGLVRALAEPGAETDSAEGEAEGELPQDSPRNKKLEIKTAIREVNQIKLSRKDPAFLIEFENTIKKYPQDTQEIVAEALKIARERRSRGSYSRGDDDLSPLVLRMNEISKNRNPEDAKILAESAKEYLRQRMYEKAFQDAAKALENGEQGEDNLTTYGAAANQLGAYDIAAQAASAALRLNPDNKTAFAIQQLSQGRQPTVALPSALPASAPISGTFAAASGSGPSRYSSGNPLASGAEIAAVISRKAAAPPSAVEKSAALTREAASALSVKDYAVAHEVATQAIDLNPRNAQAYNFRAIADNKLQRYNDAVYDASAALALAPGNSPALQSRSWAFNNQKKYREGLADANVILESEPENPYAYQNRAFALAGLGQREEMLSSLKRSAELDPRFKPRYEAALQVPENADVLFLFDDAPAAAPAPAPKPGARKKRFMMLSLTSISGGVLVALGLLHILSASWREKVRSTIRRAIGKGGGFWGQYELIREVGAGGMGVVYEAKDRSLDRLVAVKKMRDEIRQDPQERDRFITEARTVAALHHPNIVDIYSIVEDAADVYLVFEYVKGRTLAELIREQGPLPFEAARRIIQCACEGVDYAHRHKVIHRDIKPSNIMIGEGGVAKVMDFGVARQTKESMSHGTMTHSLVGTPPYMAPEQEQGEVRAESDVFGLGVVFYEMLSGRLPFQGQGAGMLLNKIKGVFTPISEILGPKTPPGLDVFFAKALNADPGKRYRGPAEFLLGLDKLGPPPYT